MKRTKKAYELYVCPQCFQQVNKCTCKYFPPWMLICIDLKMQEIVRILNEKNYKTIGCCEGHFDGNSRQYVSFGLPHNFDTLPEGFMYNPRKKSVYVDLRYDTEEKFNDAKQEQLDKLLQWAENL